MDFYGLSFIMFAGAAVCTLGILILMFAAFRTSAAWGILSLLLPPLALAFGLTHWRVGRTGVAIVVIGFIVFGYGFYDNQRQQKELALAKQQQRDASVEVYTPPTTPQTPTATPPATTTPQTSTTTPPTITAPVAPPPATVEPGASKAERTIINMIDAHKFVGNEIVLTGKNGSVRSGVLAEVRPRSIVLEYKPKGVDTLIKTEIKEEDIELMELKP